MRLDKYLKVSRLIKRRTIASLACDNKKILVNGLPKKSSFEVSVGDTIVINIFERPLSVRVLDFKDTTKKDDAKKMYEII